MTNETWRNGNENASDVRIISNKGLESITLAAITTAAMSTFTATATGTAIINLKVNAQPAISLRRLLKLKHNQQSNDFNFNNPTNRE